ncbi:hypothetical protein DAEQUDRAFT_248714 [Daedalea quercina L-15889]|uniref:Uncharacterized protein n=1 Tax=Daedalea quercina L-15889 TaxID=1314783 RepID=A0A165QML2_9APHY|nr:hypothetical protein DAEQUDRAFT_248714 [Daedalea quercina L-15889]
MVAEYGSFLPVLAESYPRSNPSKPILIPCVIAFGRQIDASEPANLIVQQAPAASLPSHIVARGSSITILRSSPDDRTRRPAQVLAHFERSERGKMPQANAPNWAHSQADGCCAAQRLLLSEVKCSSIDITRQRISQAVLIRMGVRDAVAMERDTPRTRDTPRAAKLADCWRACHSSCDFVRSSVQTFTP